MCVFCSFHMVCSCPRMIYPTFVFSPLSPRLKIPHMAEHHHIRRIVPETVDKNGRRTDEGYERLPIRIRKRVLLKACSQTKGDDLANVSVALVLWGRVWVWCVCPLLGRGFFLQSSRQGERERERPRDRERERQRERERERERERYKHTNRHQQTHPKRHTNTQTQTHTHTQIVRPEMGWSMQ